MPSLFYELVAAVFGLLIGSFSNVLILRDDRRASIVTGRSECPECKHRLSWFELVPVLSFVVQGGRCRSCRRTISFQYPFVELLSAGLWLFAASYGIAHASLLAIAPLGFCLSTLLVISVIDIRTQTVALEYCAAAALFGALSAWLIGSPPLSLLLGALAGGGLLGGVLLLWKRLTGQDGMGEGDVWIAAALGLAAGWPLVAVSLLAAVFLGSLVGLSYALITRRGLKLRMPFGPFLAAGLLISLVWGQTLLGWYILQLQ